MHNAAPSSLNVPAPHMAAVALVDPSAQTYPAWQGPTHALEIWPSASPYRPALHKPLHAAVVRPVSQPYVPGAHGVQSPDPATLYVPDGHSTAVELVLPAGHAYPALHTPLHDADGKHVSLPYVPPGHTVQVAAPPALYLPAGHAVC